MLRLKSLGQTLIEADDARLTPAAETVFATALYLIIEAGRPIGREELTRLLWPGVSDARAQHGLRQALYKLKTLGATIKADRSTLTLAPRFCTTDFGPLLAAQPTSMLEALSDKIDGSFLPGYRPQLSDEFASWVERQRDVVHSAIARTLVAGVQSKKRVSDWSGAERLATLCLTIDPLNEEATLTVAEAAALSGSKTKALSILNHYLQEIGEGAGEIKLPAAVLRRRISEAYKDNLFPVQDAPFVGRGQEMAELARALERARDGHGSSYVIWGEPGIGKTRLVSEFTRVAALQHVCIVRARSQAHDVRRPLSAFVDLIPQLLVLPGAMGCAPESMQYLRRLTAHNPDEIRNRGQLEQTDIRYDSARTALVDILDAVSAETCCLLQIEDAHWLDPQSIRMMEEIADWLGQHQILLLATSRSFSPASERISPIEVRPLPVDASRTVAHALAREGSLIDEAYFMWCISSSGGNPYYLIELLRKDPHEGNKYEAPASLTRLLHARVLMLSFEARRLLEVCCVLGIHSTIERIEKTIELSRSAILRALDELDTSGMIELEGSRVLSRHDLLSSVVLILMRGSVKVTLHRYVAIQLEAEADVTHSIGLIWESAEHWLSACDAPRAIQLLRRCGNHLIDVGMSEEAARVLERAAGLSSEPSEQYLIGTERARALMRADRSVEAVIVIDELLLIRPSIYPRPSPLDEVGVMSLQARWRNGGVLPSLVREGLDWLSSPNTIPKERISAARWLLAAADNLCDSALGQQVYDHVVLDLKSESISADERLMFEMIYNCCVGDARLSVDLANELVSYARRMNAPSLSMNYLRHAAHVHRCHAKIDDAIALAMEAVEIAGRLNASQALAIGAGFLSTLFMHVGDNRSADLWLKRAEQSNSRHDNAILVLNTLGCRAELAIRMEQEQVAESCVSQCGPAAERWQAARSYARTFALETHLAVLKGNSISERSLNSFVELFDVVKSTVFQDYSAEALVLGLKSAGRLEDARRVADGFVLEHRRDLSSLSTTLASVVSSLKLTVE